MRGPMQARLAYVTAGTIGALAAASGLFLFVLDRHVLYGNDIVLWSFFTPAAIAFAVAGVAIIKRSTVPVIGWLCLLTGGALQLSLFLSLYGIYAIVTSPGALPVPQLALVLGEPLPLVYLGGLVLILLVFPSGRPVSPPWRWVVGATVAALVVVVSSSILDPHTVVEIWSDQLSHAGASAVDPWGIPALHGLLNGLRPIGAVVFALCAIASVVSLFVRRRRASVDERKQIRWLTLVAGAILVWIIVVFPIAALMNSNLDGPAGALFWFVITPLVALGPPIAIGIGIVKYRLFDIDVVIRKTVVVAVVAFSITALYLAVLALAALAPASRALVALLLVALTFNPMRRAARAIGDRIAYGRRASTYDVLSDFSERIAETYAADDVLPRMATVLASGTGATDAAVWLRVGQELRPEAWVGKGAPPVAVALSGDDLPDLGPDAVEIRQAGELLGALTVVMPANDPLDAVRRTLIRDMAAQAGLVLRNVRLIEELRASRQRLVSAQDEERRKIERNLHDGAQQQLVALTVQLKLARTMLERDPAKAGVLLDQVEGAAGSALEDLRDLARGIYPPLLADKGLTAALEGQARKAAISVTVDADRITRYHQDVEAAVYFCTLEALNNVAKYANATRAVVVLRQDDGRLTFTVTDDGTGFDTATTGYGTGLQGMADRLDAIGGRLDVTSEPGAGTSVTGTVPV